MSEFAYFRFMSNNMLTVEEQQHKDEIITLTEEVLDAKGIECDSKISKISEEQLREILEGVRRLRKRKEKKKKSKMIEEEEEEQEEEDDGEIRQKEEEEELDIAIQ
jgi:retron-type reverse transcriptase